MNEKYSRRSMLKSLLGGAGALGLRSLATGLPIGFLANPLAAKADDFDEPGRILIFAAQSAGDPLNCNTPGTYDIPDLEITHAPYPEMAPTPVALGDKTYTGAYVWSTLPQSIRDKMVFIHHKTYSGIHPDFNNVMRLMGSAKQDEMLPSICAANTAERLGTIQEAPVCLGNHSFSYAGRFQPRVKPLALKAAFAKMEGDFLTLQDLRDSELDRMHNLVKGWGNSEQAWLVDRFATTQEQVRQLSDSLVDGFAALDSDSEQNQAKAAALVAALGLTPAITLNMNFGGDNHKDGDLQNEIDKHLQSIATIGNLFADLEALKNSGVLTRDVVFAWTSVFGRTLKANADGGRDHNANHCVTVIIGDRVNPGVIGDARALAVDSQTGEPTPNSSGDIPPTESLESMAKTLATVVGVEPAYRDEWIERGTVIDAAVN